MKKSIVLIGLILICVMSIAAISPVIAAVTTNKTIDGKGAAAQWVVSGRTINAVLSMNNSGKDAILYVSIIHLGGRVSSDSAPAICKWSMDHVTAEATLDFAMVTGTGRTGTHVISITWETSGPALNGVISITTANGMAVSIDGTWKTGGATLVLSPIPEGGHHGQEDTYSSANLALVIHGQASIGITT
jgi:hypothetical protein